MKVTCITLTGNVRINNVSTFSVSFKLYAASLHLLFSSQSYEKAVKLDSAHASAHLNLGVIFHLQVSTIGFCFAPD